MVVEAVIEPRSGDVYVAFPTIVGRKSVIGVARNRRRLGVEKGMPKSGMLSSCSWKKDSVKLVSVPMPIANEGATPKRWLRTKATSFHVRPLAHQRQAQSAAFAGDDVEIGGAAELAVAATGQRELVDRVELRLLGHLIDDAARRTAAEQGGSRPFDDLHALVIEGVLV